MQDTTEKITYLEGIRGVAALLVFFHHFLLAFYSAYYSFDITAVHLHNLEISYGQSLFSVFTNGNFCVRIFFVLSGYVLSRKYFLSGAFSVIVSGAQRRFVRLYIPVAFVIILAFVLMQCGLFMNVPVSSITHSDWWFERFWQMDHPVTNLFRSLTYSTMFFGDDSFDTCLRTMSTEFYGSMFVFAFLALTHSTRNRFTMLVLSFLFCCYTREYLLSAFVFGISLNYVERHRDTLGKKLRTFLAVVLFVAALLLGAYPPEVAVGTFYAALPQSVLACAEWFHIIGAFFLVLAFVLSATLQQMISNRVFTFLGYISFSFYLLHPLVLGTFSSYIFLVLYGHTDYNTSVLLVFLLTTAVCLFLSWLMTKYVDEPGVKYARYLYDRWSKESVAANRKAVK